MVDRSERRSVPASKAEAGIWLACAIDPAVSPHYNAIVDLELDGPVELAEVNACLAAVLDRHPALRSRFVTVRGRLRREPVPAAAGCTLHLGTSAYDRDAALAASIDDARLPFDLSAGPLLRAVLVRAAGGCLVTLVAHHIVTDGRSLEILYQDFVDALETLRRTGLATVTRARGTRPATTATATADGYWSELLTGPVHYLAAGPMRRPADGARRPAQHDVPVPADRRAAVSRFAARARVSPAIVLLAAWLLVLCAESGASDGVIGTPFGTRAEAADFDEIGMFTRMLPVRVRIRPDEPVEAYVRGIRDQMLASMSHAAWDPAVDLPFLASYVHEPRYEQFWRLPDGTAARVVERAVPAAKYPIGLAAFDGRDGLLLRIDYDANRYPPGAVAGLAGLVVATVDAITAPHPASTLSDLSTTVGRDPAEQSTNEIGA